MIPLQNFQKQHLGALLPAGIPDDCLSAFGEWSGECVFMALPTQTELFNDPAYRVLDDHSHQGLGEHRLRVVSDEHAVTLLAVAVDGSELFVRLPKVGPGVWGMRCGNVETQLGCAVKASTRPV
ncbi:MAG: hypothetical protein QM796_09805 [Chthoniobacteraceae bacterium]